MHSLSADQLWRSLAFSIDTASAADSDGDTATGACQREAFEAFFWRYERRIITYLWRMTGTEQVALDLAQETFLRAWQHFAVIGKQEEAQAWLFKVATNLALTHLQHHSGTHFIPLEDDLPSQSDPAREVALSDSVMRVLRQLPLNQRSALILQTIYGLNCDEIGAALRLSRGAVKTTLWRAREAFRSLYQAQEEL